MSQSLNLEEGQVNSREFKDGGNSISEKRLLQGRSKRTTKSTKSLSNTLTQIILSLHKFYSSKGPLGNSFFLVLCMYSMFLDALFLYTPVINNDKKCYKLDIGLLSFTSIYRTSFDWLYLRSTISEMWNEYSHQNSKSKSKTKLLSIILYDTFIILPLPQVVVILAACQSMRARKFFLAMNFFLFQHVLKVIRVYTLFQKAKNSGNLAGWARMAFNIWFFHAGHVFGAIWYFFAIERQTVCWRKACKNDNVAGCDNISFYCSKSLGNYTISDDFCSTKTQNSTTYDFGIFQDAIKSGVVEANNFFPRVFPCFRWGIQTVCWFGQGLPFSADFNENILAMTITISGVVLFFFLIGRVQSSTVDLEDRKRKLEAIKHWQPFRKLPEKLQQQVKHQSRKWRETRRVDVEYVVNNVSEDLGYDIKRKLCLDLLKKVEEFGKWTDALLEVLCDLAKPVFYRERSYIVQEGDTIDQMLFVLRGKLWTYNSNPPKTESSRVDHQNNKRIPLQNNDSFGLKLVSWAQNEASNNLPVSTRTIQALTNVEAFVLMAEDLKKGLLLILIKKNWAARCIQLFWRSRRNAEAFSTP